MRINALYKLKNYDIHSRIHHLEEKSYLNIVFKSYLNIVGARAAPTKYYRLGGLNDKNLFFSQLWKSEV